MKKLYAIIIAFILVFNTTIVFKSNKSLQVSINIKNDLNEHVSSNNASIVSQNTQTLYQTNHYSTYYYKNLTTNYGRNVKGSCTYVAFAMLLSYYDTFWNDSIIPENYDMVSMLPANQLTTQNESPGIYTESSAIAPIGISTEDYYQVIQQYSSAHFHLKLIQMGKEKFGQYKFSSSNSPCALTLNELQELINYYLYEYMQFTSLQISYTTATSNVRNFTIQKVKQGIPVLLRMGQSLGTLGHAFVAYDYDEVNDELYGHFGVIQPKEHIKISSSDYDLYWDATVLNVNMPHSCSDNYKYSSNNNLPSVTHCPCEFDFHPSRHVHTYNHRYVWYDAYKHKAYCECGAMKMFVHCVSSGSSFPRSCIECGGTADSGIVEYGLNMGIKIITENGSYILPNGVIVLSDADYQGYLNGTFVIPHSHDIAA